MHPTHHLRGISRVVGVLLSMFAVTIGVRGQKLPPTPPTTLPGQVAPGALQAPGTPQASIAAPDPARHAEVILTRGLLQIRADNSSLNQILRSISQITGLKIKGGVEEQRVFGSYGPAPLSTILATLLDGTGANILLLGGNAGTPPELVLTSRVGGAEPPGPNSPAYAMYDDSTDRSNRVASPAAQPAASTPTIQTPAVATSAAATSAPPSAGTPAKVLTPEMVMQELQQMQAQQDQKNKNANTTKPQNPSTPPPTGSNPQ
jgi:hypothetical protein